jgi:phosphatidate phosphatase APP1
MDNNANLKDLHVTVKVYHGYGHTHNCVVYGHVLEGKRLVRRRFTRNIFYNIIHLIRSFMVKPLPGLKVRLNWQHQELNTVTALDGFFKFEWASDTEIAAGWHPVKVHLIDEGGNIVCTGDGNFYVPHSTQYAFISDIDDTVLVSHSATMAKRLRVLFTKNPRTRKAFADVVKHYHLLAFSHTSPSTPNPFFYVSSSEWNLYDDLDEFFRHNGLPEGVFMLNEIKRWSQLFKTGKTKHNGKLIRVVRIMQAFPKQQFVLFGDNSQSDPEIYASVANKYPANVAAVYIRNISPEKEAPTREFLSSLTNKSIHTLLFDDNTEAINHSKRVGLL